MKEFDYERAYREVAEPAWFGLPPVCGRLLAETAAVAAAVDQDRTTLATCWPSGERGAALRAEFLAAPGDALTRASQAIYYAGHWAFRDRLEQRDMIGLWLQRDGLYWKFSSYADQTMREKIGMTSPDGSGRYGHGAHVQLHEGLLRLCVSTPWSQSWKTVGPATEELYWDLLVGIPDRPFGTRSVWEEYEDECLTRAVRVRDEVFASLTPDDPAHGFRDMDRFMVEKPERRR